jgi:hypothetical protein
MSVCCTVPLAALVVLSVSSTPARILCKLAAGLFIEHLWTKVPCMRTVHEYRCMSTVHEYKA